jgi:hypothetical protein
VPAELPEPLGCGRVTGGRRLAGLAQRQRLEGAGLLRSAAARPCQDRSGVQARLLPGGSPTDRRSGDVIISPGPHTWHRAVSGRDLGGHPCMLEEVTA